MRTTPVRNSWLRFAVLRHTDYPGRQDHHDIVLEVSTGRDPDDIALMKFESTAPLDHSELDVTYQGSIRRRYLHFEGPMSGNRGLVVRVDEGVYRLTGLNRVEFEGTRLRGSYVFDLDSPCELLRSIKNATELLRHPLVAN